MNESISFGGRPVVGFGDASSSSVGASVRARLVNAASGAIVLGLVGVGVGVGVSYARSKRLDDGTVGQVALGGAIVGAVAGAIL